VSLSIIIENDPTDPEHNYYMLMEG